MSRVVRKLSLPSNSVSQEYLLRLFLPLKRISYNKDKAKIFFILITMLDAFFRFLLSTSIVSYPSVLKKSAVTLARNVCRD